MSGQSLTLTPSRLTLARERRGLTLSALARAVGVTPRTVTRWESGDVQPAPDKLAAFVDVLEMPEAFFFADEVEELTEDAISFRALSKTPAGRRNAAISAGRLTITLERWIETRFRLPTPDVPTLPKYEPEMAAQVVRERWGVGNAPIANLVHLLEAHGVRVFSLAADISAIDAFSLFTREGTPFILINTTKTGERQRFDAAHELGHLVIHCEGEVPHGREAEQQAQRFAAAFLMPRDDVMAQPLWHADTQRILTAKRRWRVAAMALTHRLRELGMLTEWGYRDACVYLSQAGYRRGEPFGSITPETSQVLGKVFHALRERHVKPTDLAADLHLTVEELNRHVFGLVPVSVSGEGRGGGPSPNLRVVRNPEREAKL
jgi:Zn-dependent peptidase ImmA (M78 family)/DNA-binding XRE family transcriptional regulator